METPAVSHPTRFSPVALALVLLVLLAALAMRAEANEGVIPENAGPEAKQWLRQESGISFEEYKAQRGELVTELREDRALWRASTSAAVDAHREELKARVEERRAEREATKEEVRARLAAAAQERLGTFVTRMTERMDAILDHLETVADRVESRITKIEEVVETELTDASTALEEARDRIDDARADVAYLADLAAEALASDDPKAQMEEVREAAKIAKESIVAVHQALRDAVVLIKASASAGADDSQESEGEAEASEE